MTRVKAGDESAFDQLYRRHQQTLYTFLVARSGNAQDAAEVLQETWNRVWFHCQGFDCHRRFRPWLYQIALNLRNRVYGSARRYDETKLQLNWQIGTWMEMSDSIRRAELERSIGATMARIPEKKRDVLLVACYLGMDSIEGGESLRISPEAFRKRLHDARHEFQMIFREIHGEWHDV